MLYVDHLKFCDLHTEVATFMLFLPVLDLFLPLKLFIYLCLTFSLLPTTTSHSHASSSDSTFNHWHYINLVDIVIGNK